MAVEASPAPVSGMAFMTLVTGVLAVVGRGLMTGPARDPGVLSGLDIEPKGAVRVGKLILEMALLAFPAGAVRRMRKGCASIGGLMAAGAACRPGNDPEGLQVPMAVAAFDRLVGSHQRKAGLVVVELGLVPIRFPVANIAIPALAALVKIDMAGRAVPAGFQELPILMAGRATDILVKSEEILGRVPEFQVGKRLASRMAVFAFFTEIRAVRRFVAAVAVGLELFLTMTGVAVELSVSTLQGKAGGRMLFDLVGLGLRRRRTFLGGFELDFLGPAAPQGETEDRQSQDKQQNYFELRYSFHLLSSAITFLPFFAVATVAGRLVVRPASQV